MATDSGARLLGGFHDSSFANDRFRLNAFAGSGKFNLKFYGTSENSQLVDNPLPYQMDGTIGQVRGAVRIRGTENWFAGLTYQFLQSTLTFKTSEVNPEQPDVPRNFRSAGLGPQMTYDSRDSNYYPTSGQYARVSWLNFGSRWGGDFEFDKIDAFYNHYLPLDPSSLLAFRVRLQDASSGTPFFALPTLDMRGFSSRPLPGQRHLVVHRGVAPQVHAALGHGGLCRSRPVRPELARAGRRADHQDRRQRRALAGDGRARHERRRRLCRQQR